MPLYEWKCESGHVTEDIIRVHDPIPSTVVCGCGLVATKILSRIARTPGRWGESAATWNEGLGCYATTRDIDRICAERGIVPLTDLPNDYIETSMHNTLERDKFADRCIDAIQTTDIADVDTKSALDEAPPT